MIPRPFTRRAFALAILAASCGYETSPIPALHDLDVRLPPERTGDLLNALQRFARQHGFNYSAARLPRGMQRFSLHRADIWIEGSSGFKPPLIIETPKGPEAHSEIDPTRMGIAVFPSPTGRPQTSEVDMLVRELTAALNAIDGVSVRPAIHGAEERASAGDGAKRPPLASD